VDLTAVAAFTAAALSLVNVVLSYRLTGRGHREQWRREQERPAVARSITLSADASHEWWDASVKIEHEGGKGSPHWEQGWKLLTDLRYEAAQLDLLASRPVREAVGELIATHQREATRLVAVIAARDRSGEWERRIASQAKIKALGKVLVERTRADLGLGPGIQVPPRSLLAKLLGRYQEQPRPDD
jgi:hypothetical protein